MEEKEEPVKGSGGGAVVEKEEKQTNTGSEGSRKSKASKGPNGNGENRESIGSAVSPSLNRLIVGDAEDGSSNKPEISSKAQRRAKRRARKKAKKDKASKLKAARAKASTDPQDSDPDDSSDDESTILSSSSNRSRQEDAEHIRKLEAMIVTLTAKAKLGRRKSVADVGVELNNRMIYSLAEVKDDEKLKTVNGYTLLDLFMRIEDAKVIGQHKQIISYLSLEVKNNLLLFLSQGNAKEAGWHSHEFSEIRDLNSLSDSDIQNLLVLIARPNEKGTLVRILNNVKIPLSPTTADKPLYLALKPILRGVLSYLQTYEKLYRMLSGEQGVLINGKTIGEDPNMTIELSKKVKGGDKYLDSHESILRNTLVNNGPIPMKFFDSLKASEDRGVTNYLFSAVQSIERIHPRVERTPSSNFVIKAAKETRFTQVMTFPDRPGVFGQVLIETMKFNINMYLTIYDKLVMPFYSMMQAEQYDSKTRKVASMLGYILSNNEDDEEREVIIERVMNEEYADDYEHRICHLEESLADAREEAAIATRNFNELNAARNSELLYAANNPSDGRYPVKIATGATSTLRKPGQVTILTKKPCFAEARKEGTCSYGASCRYSHDKRDLDKLRNDPKASQNLQVLNVLAEHSPEVYDAKAAEFSSQY